MGDLSEAKVVAVNGVNMAELVLRGVNEDLITPGQAEWVILAMQAVENLITPTQVEWVMDSIGGQLPPTLENDLVEDVDDECAFLHDAHPFF